jgi:predicted nucleic acid-binding protein
VLAVLANAIGDDGADGRSARSQLRAQAGALAALDRVDVETVAVLRKRRRARTITDRRFATAIKDLQELDLDRYPTLRLMTRACGLRANLTA